VVVFFKVWVRCQMNLEDLSLSDDEGLCFDIEEEERNMILVYVWSGVFLSTVLFGLRR
jgi:hypothetical protein